MKFVHLSDLHLGKRINGFSMLDDQHYILNQILSILRQERPDGVLLAGDIYDKTIPSGDAVELFDQFLVGLSQLPTQVFVISGNHDCPERLAFGGRLMKGSGIHLSPVYSGQVLPITLEDTHGPVQVYLLPFLKPAQVRRHFPDKPIDTYTDAVATAIAHMAVNPRVRNVLVAHQFVTGAQPSESEELSVGGLDNVDAAVFAPFDYVALGHIHRPQNIGGIRVRYCGAPLKYTFSEAGHQKSLTVVEMGEKSEVTVRTIPLTPKRDLVELRGSYQQLTLRETYQDAAWREDYVHVILTDEQDVPDAIGRLRVIYPNLMKLTYDNARTRRDETVDGGQAVERRGPLELFSQLYQIQNNQEMSPEQFAFVQGLIGTIWGGEP